MTLFEKIMSGELPGQFLYEDEHCVVLRDINPQAPVHFLVVPRKVIARVGEAGAEEAGLLGHLLLVAAEVARQEGVAESGFRVIINHGRDGGETVPHLHVHVLGGRPLHWPPG
jgi:histidine triad (HIT) family protein